ncbi:hypothetical protein HBH46_158160 [Parastagonospora nodorum]|nr:hypothetical protein HBH46_158160 [Parastagonospora nodorum]
MRQRRTDFGAGPARKVMRNERKGREEICLKRTRSRKGRMLVIVVIFSRSLPHRRLTKNRNRHSRQDQACLKADPGLTTPHPHCCPASRMPILPKGCRESLSVSSWADQGVLAAHWSAARHPLQRRSLRQARASAETASAIRFDDVWDLKRYMHDAELQGPTSKH